MAYYGDYAAGDPGLFSKIGRFIGRAAGAVVRGGLPALAPVLGPAAGVLGVLSKARQIRSATPAATMPAAAAPPGTRFVGTARRGPKRRRAISAYRQRLAALRIARARRS